MPWARAMARQGARTSCAPQRRGSLALDSADLSGAQDHIMVHEPGLEHLCNAAWLQRVVRHLEQCVVHVRVELIAHGAELRVTGQTQRRRWSVSCGGNGSTAQLQPRYAPG